MLLTYFGRFVAGLIVIAVSTAIISGQPAKNVRLAPTVAIMESLYLGDRGLQEELKLTPEQVRQLTLLVQNAFGDYFSSWHSAKLLDERSKIQEAAHAKVLKTEQRTRLRQVILQHLGRVPAGPETLAADVGVVKKLDLTDAQVQDLKSRKRLPDILTEKQKTTWAELCGPAYAKRLIMTGVGGSIYSRAPQSLMALRLDMVIVDLKLTDDQEERLESLRSDWLDLFPVESLNDVTKYEGEFTRSAKAVLTEQQRVRFEQQLLQIAVRTTPNLSVYELPGVGEAIGLKAEQIKQIAAKRKERRKGLLALFLNGDTSATVREKIAAHDAETPKVLASLVTPEQQAKLKELLGVPLDPIPLARVASYSTDYWYRLPPARSGYLAIFALTYGSYEQVHTLLKFNADQIKQVTALQKEMDLLPDPKKVWPTGPEDDEKRREMADTISKRLAVILKPEQIKAWMQLTIQNYPLQGRFDFAPYPQLLATREVRDALKLTPKQLRRFDHGATLSEVLDADQKKAWLDLAGMPLPQKPSSPLSSTQVVFSFNMYADPVISQLVAVSDDIVQKHLGLSDKQKAAIKVEQKTAQGSYGPTTSQIRDEVIQKRGAEILDAVTKILDEPQRRRLMQIGIQQAMQYEGKKPIRIYSHPVVAAALKLSPKQVETLKTLVVEHEELIAMTYSVIKAEDFTTSDDHFQMTIDLAGVTEKRFLDVLTADQKAAFKELLGEPYKGIVRPTSRAFLPW